jgi:hypothetical protein
MVRDFAPLSENSFLILETAHLWLFAVGMGLVMQAAVAAINLGRTKDYWDVGFARGLRVLEGQVENSRWGPGWEDRFSWVICGSPVAQARLWVLRKHFINRMQLSATFDFACYLRRSLTRRVLDDVEVGWKVWLVLTLLFGVGFVVARAINIAPVHIDPEYTALTTTLTTAVLAALCVLALVALGHDERELLRRAGVPRPRSCRSVLETALTLYSSEENDILDPAGGLTADQVRLDLVLQECRHRDHVDSPEYRAKHRRHDISAVRLQRDVVGLLTTRWPRLFRTALRITMLTQGYMFGLTIIMLLSFGQTHVNDGALGMYLLLELLLHLLVICLLFPTAIRYHAVLCAVCIVDEPSLDRIEDAFAWQQTANESLYVLSTALFGVYTERLWARLRAAEAAAAAAAAPAPDPAAAAAAAAAAATFAAVPPPPPSGGPEEERIEVPRTLTAMTDLHREAVAEVHALLLPGEEGGVSAAQLHSSLAAEPFVLQMRTQRISMVFRALGCRVRGLGLDETSFLIKGMERLHRGARRAEATLQACFPAALACAVCGTQVALAHAHAHAQVCGDTAKAARVGGAQPPGGAPESPRPLSQRILKLNSGLKVNKAKYGLLRPFELTDQSVVRLAAAAAPIPAVLRDESDDEGEWSAAHGSFLAATNVNSICESPWRGPAAREVGDRAEPPPELKSIIVAP